MRLKTTVATIALILAATPASAQTLAEAMDAAVMTNPSLAAQRQRLRATREVLPQALSEALPQVNLSGSATRSNTDQPGNVGDSEDWSAGASASQLIFGSGRVIANTSAARSQIRGAVADYDLTLQTLLLDVTRAYADVRQAQAVVAAGEQSVQNLNTLYEYARAQFDAGVVTRTDVAQAQARLAQTRTRLVQAQGQLAAAVQAYTRLVGAPPSDLQAPPDAENLPADLETALTTAGTQSPVLRGAAADADQADALIHVARSGGLPRVSLEAGQNVFGDFNSGADDENSDSVGLRVTWPIFNGGATWSRTRQQRALASAANLDLAAAQRSVQESVTNAWTGLASARSAVVSAREEVEAAELAYEGVRLERETGLRSTVEVLNQEEDLLTARIALAQAEHDMVVAERALLAAQGTLTPPTANPNPDIRGRR